MTVINIPCFLYSRRVGCVLRTMPIHQHTEYLTSSTALSVVPSIVHVMHLVEYCVTSANAGENCPVFFSLRFSQNTIFHTFTINAGDYLFAFLQAGNNFRQFPVRQANLNLADM